MSTKQLFADGDLDNALRTQILRIPERVNRVPTDQFLVSTDEQLLRHFESELQVEPLVLHEDRAEMDQVEAMVDVRGDRNRYWSIDHDGPRMIPGTEVTVTIPYTGDQQLWDLKPNPCRLSFPEGLITPHRGDQAGALIIKIERPHDADQGQFRQGLEDTLSDVRDHIKNQRGQVERFNEELPRHIQAAISARRDRLKKHEGLSAIMEIPLRRKEGVPPIAPIKMERKITQPLPPPPRSGFKPEPGITDELYENILSIIRHEGRTFETAPLTFSKLEEEELRDIMLAHLNGHYQGNATGETFRKRGKTDIRIEDQERAAFVCECKIWGGSKELIAGIGQLLGYLTWRDCKANLVLFNKHVKGFTKLLQTVPDTLAQHPLILKDLGQQGAGEWRHIFRSQEDEDRLITVHTFLFNLCVE